MAKRKHTPEEIINKLREAEVVIAAGSTVGEASRCIGVSEQTFYRWRAEYGGLRVDQTRRLKRLETENSRLKRAVAEPTLETKFSGRPRRETSDPRPSLLVVRTRPEEVPSIPASGLPGPGTTPVHPAL